jgi:KaiC/GvpD/RAD55 family RecA-like ATPase
MEWLDHANQHIKEYEPEPTMQEMQRCAAKASNGDEILYTYIMDHYARRYGIPDGGDHPYLQPIHWPDMWEHDIKETWIADPILPEGRLVALYAAGKTGKSLLTLEIALAKATGKPTLNEPKGDPISVVYIDMEMTLDDLQHRMEDLGYTEKDDLSLFHYYQLAPFDPFDTEQGADQLQHLVNRHNPKLLIIDTVARTVAGAENDSDTYRNLYRIALRPLKAQGVTVLRIDHAGKDATRGQRGSSAKNDDVDVVWRLEQGTTPDSLQLVCDRRRIAWVPQIVNLQRAQSATGHLRHHTEALTLNKTQLDLVADFDDMGIDPEATRSSVRKQHPNYTFSNSDYGPVQKYRRVRGWTPNPKLQPDQGKEREPNEQPDPW